MIFLLIFLQLFEAILLQVFLVSYISKPKHRRLWERPLGLWERPFVDMANSKLPLVEGRGGARHFAKPYVDSGLVLKVLEKSSDEQPKKVVHKGARWQVNFTKTFENPRNPAENVANLRKTKGTGRDQAAASPGFEPGTI